MGKKELAEAIILQSVEDILNGIQTKECRRFFYGEGFRVCASLAGMELTDRLKLTAMVRKSFKCNGGGKRHTLHAA